jgi:iron complex outermembrane receptor protein
MLFGFTLATAGTQAADRGESPRNLADLSIEELMNESITLVARKEQRLGDTAAAVSVLSNDDLRRSGVTTVAEALRLVPGMQVAAIDSASWAISARGFNSQFANKLLAMIDGRTLYSPLYSGVYWDSQQVMLDDVDRIEVIRGPGATVWGANAVNGVINVVSKSARETQGGFIYGGGGDARRALGGARYGGKMGDGTYYRVYGTYQLSDDFRYANGEPANDRWDIRQGGYRIDHYADNDSQLTWQGDVYSGHLADYRGEMYGVNSIGRWSRRLSERSDFEVQAFLDHAYRNDLLGDASLDTVDLTWQHTFGLGERNDVIWGMGYRFTQTRATKSNSPIIRIVDSDVPLHLFSAFVQDEIKLVPDRLLFTLGTKLEHNDFTGFEVQPSARLVFKPTHAHTIWAAVSRAVRTPSEVEGHTFINFVVGPPANGPGGELYTPTIAGNPRAESEVLWAYELGYRAQPSDRLSVDVATFRNVYRNLLAFQPTAFFPSTPLGTMSLQAKNTLHGEAYGGEVMLTATPVDGWRLSAGYSLLVLHMQGEPTSEATALERNAPTDQLVLRSSNDISARTSLDLQLRYVDDVQAVPAYVTADIRLSYRPADSLELSIVGQNLLDDQHPEQASPIGLPITEVPRGFYARITQRF